MIFFMRKLQDLARSECELWGQRGVLLRHKIQFAVSRLLLLTGGKSVLWLGRRPRVCCARDSGSGVVMNVVFV